MEAPDKIFLQVCGSCDLDETCEKCEFTKLLEGGEVTWSEDRIYENDIEYIRKNALLKWAKAYKEEADATALGRTDNSSWGESVAMKNLINKLNSM